MKVFLFTYESPRNCLNGKIVIRADDITEAQDKFFVWVKGQPTYPHMWSLAFSAKEVEYED